VQSKKNGRSTTPIGAAVTIGEFELLQQAAHWFALLRSEQVSAQDRHQWQTWLDQREEHRDAWRTIENVSRRLEPLQSTGERHAAGDVLKKVRRQQSTRRQTLAGIMAVAGTGIVGLAAWRTTPIPALITAWSADYHTGVGEIKTIVMADGTRVWLNTRTAINLRYGEDLRRLQLLDGEILIETASDKTRPFVVDTSFGRLRALGTRFTVRQSDKLTYLAVYEGAVEASAVPGGHRNVVINAGEQVTFDVAEVSAPAIADPARQAWSRGVLLADNTLLADLMVELERYHHVYLAVSPSARGLRVMGTYPANDLNRTLSMLESALPLKIDRTLPWWINIGMQTADNK
jgi:transmembrane sensor